MSNGGATAADLVDALGTAWTIHGLYPDPENQPAFARAVADVSSIATDDRASLSVGPGAFVIDGEELRTERQAAERLAIRLYVYNVESLRVTSSASDRDVIHMFDILSREPDAVAAAGGVGAALARDGITAFSVIERTDLGDRGPIDEVERDSEVIAVMTEGLDPAAFADALMSLASGNPDVAGKVIHDQYRDVLGRVSSDDPTGRETLVRAFVEAFFHLPDLAQVSVLEQFLERQTEADDQAFLDQFACHELALLSSRLDTQAIALLMDYANIVTDPEADARSDELLAVLGEVPEAVTSARQLIASHMTQRWGAIVDGVDTPTTPTFEPPDPQWHFYTVLDVFRDLLAIEDRDDRFGRLMRIWSGKVVGALRRGEFRRAELWLRSVGNNPTFGSERKAAVDAAMGSLIRSSMVEQLVSYYGVLEDPTPVLRIMSITGPRLADPLIERLAEVEDAGERRILTQLLAFVAAADPAPVVARLTDARWYLVCNLAVILRQSGRVEASVGLRSILGHEDPRVRVEAVRGVAVLEGEAGLDAVGAALADGVESVRTAALAALGGQDNADAERRLMEALASPSLTTSQRTRTIELLGRDPTPQARELLVRLANRRFVVTATARVVRDAARKALDGKKQRRSDD